MKILLAGALALLMTGNGLTMLFASPWWFHAVPGVICTGPYNAHFVKDIGAAYLAAGAALVWRAARPSADAAFGTVAAAAAFLVLHALIHVADELAGTNGLSAFVRDFPGVFVPALLAAWIAWPVRKTA